MKRAVLGAALCLFAAGCEVTAPPPPSRIGGAQFITFRCAPRVTLPAEGFPALGAAGAPLDGCGCTQYRDDGVLGLLDAAACVTGNAEVRAYVAGNSVGEVAVVRLNRGPATGEARILDSDETVPGVTGIYVDDIVSDLESDPAGRFVISVNATSGTLSIIVDDFALQPALVIEPGLGPLSSIAVWPPIEQALPRDADGLELPAIRRAWITAPTARRVLELDLEQVSALLDGVDVPADAVVTRIYDMPGTAVPAAIAVHPDGQRIYVGHAATPAITEFDVETGAASRVLDLSRRAECRDGYLANVISRDADESCADGFDNDGDGVSDADDPDCQGEFAVEWADSACPQRAGCADGIDNNGDGLVDRDDPTCAAGDGRWEGEPPACANGIDDDGDGLVDREDLGCRTEADNDERPAGDGLESGSQCADGQDNDGDGLIDLAEDPGCSDTLNAAARYAEERPSACADGLDNDGDGLIDFVGGDTDCYAASDDAEGASRLELGPREIVTARFVINGQTRHYLYTTESVGFLVSADLDANALVARYTGLERTVVDMTLRQRGEDNALLAIVSDSTLRSLLITEPAPLLTEDGRDVFARFDGAYEVTRIESFDDESFDVGHFEHTGVRVQAFYTIESGAAARITALDGICPAVAQSEDGTCPPGRSPLLDTCPPTACTDGGGCPSDFACLDGACVALCETDADCGDAELCDPTVPDDGTPRMVCRTRCRVDDRGLVAVVPPRALCEDGGCGAPCVAHDECGVDLACIAGTCEAWCTADSCRAPFDPATAPPTEPGPGTPLGDPLAMRADRMRILHDEANVRRYAHERTPRVTGSPRLFVRNSPVTVGFDRYPTLCRIPQPTETAAFPGWPIGDCIPPGRTVGQGGGLIDQTDQQIEDELRYRVDTYPYLQVTENRPGRLSSQEFSLAYEGVLPRSESRTGQHAGLVDVPLAAEDSRTGEATNVEGWVLVDYDQNFCSVGVEEGDVLLIDRMVPADPDDADLVEQCADFLEVDVTLSPDQRRDPLRYRVVEVTPFKLILRPDGTAVGDTLSYGGMLRRDDRQPVPALAAPRPAPPQACMAGLSTYRVRVGEAFLLVGSAAGHRHPWVRSGGECVRDPQREERRSRVQLGVPFENEWFRLQLGPSDPEALADDPSEGPTLPYLVDVVLTFEVDGGELIRRLVDLTRLPRAPQDMRWLPNNDLLYVVDGAIQTLIEIGGLDVLRQTPVVTNPSYD